jgi:glycosyltransferase involved in cell wall biosynthesis
MNGTRISGVIAFRARAGIDSIDQYSRHLVGALEATGVETRYLTTGLSVLPSDSDIAWVLLEYNPFSYGRAGFAPGLVRDVIRLRRRARVPLAVMVHEAWVDIHGAKSAAIGLWQRAQLRGLLRFADRVMTSTEALAREIGDGAVHVPVPANITPVPATPASARDRLGLDGKLAVSLFGRANPSRALRYAEAAIAALADARGPGRLAVLNLGADAPALDVPAGIEVSRPGPLPAEELSLWLSASDIVLLPFVDGVSTRRSTLMAALAHGRPVVGLRGRNTDSILVDASASLALTPVGDLGAFSRATVALSRDPQRMRAMGDEARRMYQSQFDWSVTAQRVASVLRSLAPERSQSPASTTFAASRQRRRPTTRPRPGSVSDEPGSREIVFVVRDLGGSGGMERQTEQLVTRLLDAGRQVTVIACTCRIESREGLRFVRVRTPSRPATVGYPAFFATASLLVALRGNTLVHTTGAIIGNRVDVSTVHYCHRTADRRLNGSRASRPSPLFRVNAATAGMMSRAGESWCYRPGRAQLVCAVSRGLASDLAESFPQMRSAVRVIPNGVDAAVFRPDRQARREVRAALGIDDRTRLALFVGGDWERKGLSHAVDALAFARDWHLAVAGAGDEAPLIAAARNAGRESRLHFLGSVRDMPRLYAAGDAFVLPTGYEAFPLVALEAAATGLPLLVTRVNGIEDLMQDGLCGWFVSRDAREIARRLNELRADPELARQMAAAARSAALQFSWEAMVEGYLSLYAELRGSPSS